MIAARRTDLMCGSEMNPLCGGGSHAFLMERSDGCERQNLVMIAAFPNEIPCLVYANRQLDCGMRYSSLQG